MGKRKRRDIVRKDDSYSEKRRRNEASEDVRMAQKKYNNWSTIVSDHHIEGMLCLEQRKEFHHKMVFAFPNGIDAFINTNKHMLRMHGLFGGKNKSSFTRVMNNHHFFQTTGKVGDSECAMLVACVSLINRKHLSHEEIQELPEIKIVNLSDTRRRGKDVFLIEDGDDSLMKQFDIIAGSITFDELSDDFMDGLPETIPDCDWEKTFLDDLSEEGEEGCNNKSELDEYVDRTFDDILAFPADFTCSESSQDIKSQYSVSMQSDGRNEHLTCLSLPSPAIIDDADSEILRLIECEEPITEINAYNVNQPSTLFSPVKRGDKAETLGDSFNVGIKVST